MRLSKKIQEKIQDSCYLPDKARDLAYEFIQYTDFSGDEKSHLVECLRESHPQLPKNFTDLNTASRKENPGVSRILPTSHPF